MRSVGRNLCAIFLLSAVLTSSTRSWRHVFLVSVATVSANWRRIAINDCVVAFVTVSVSAVRLRVFMCFFVVDVHTGFNETFFVVVVVVFVLYRRPIRIGHLRQSPLACGRTNRLVIIAARQIIRQIMSSEKSSNMYGDLNPTPAHTHTHTHKDIRFVLVEAAEQTDQRRVDWPKIVSMCYLCVCVVCLTPFHTHIPASLRPGAML